MYTRVSLNDLLDNVYTWADDEALPEVLAVLYKWAAVIEKDIKAFKEYEEAQGDLFDVE